MPSSHDLHAGLFAERFRLLGLLGSGGDASVFRAVDEHTGRSVALKAMHPHLGTMAGTTETFLARARQAAAVRHPNLAAVHAFGVADGQPWMALQLVAGRTLRERVESGGVLPLDEAREVATGLLDGLTALHEHGLVHRDVTPANVMIDETGTRPTAVLLDLGLAAPRGESATEPGVDGAPLLVRGTADWMSPEQHLGEPLDERADLYQAGALLYFALTGEPPFVRESVAEVQRAHLAAPPPVASVRNPSVPPSIDRLVAHAMLKSPDARPRSAADMLRELRTALPQPTDRPASPASTAPATTRLLPPSKPFEAEGRTVLLPANRRLPGGIAPSAPGRAAEGGRRVLVPLVVLAAVIGLGAVWFVSSVTERGGPTAAATAVPSSAAPAPPPTTPSLAPSGVPAPPATPVEVPVPALLGSGIDELPALLAVHGLALGAVATAPSPAAARSVIETVPAEGIAVPRGATVDVVVASGQNAVPVVAGLDAATAETSIRAAGFSVVLTTEGSASPPAATAAPVLATFPAAGVLLTLGQTVTILVDGPAVVPSPSASPTPTATPTPTPTPVPSATWEATALTSIRTPAPRPGQASFIARSSPVHPLHSAYGRHTGSDRKARP